MPPTTYEILDLLRSAPEGELELAVRSDGRLVALLEPRSAEGPFCAARSLHANLWTPRAIRAGELPGLVLDPLLGVRADVLKERLPPPVALRLALDVLTGLDALHDAGDAHGALCPSAVLLDEEGRGRLVVLGPEPGPLETRLRYAAPEQLEGAASSFAGDVWAVGVLLHEWLTGAPLFEGRGWEVVARIAADDPHARRPAELAPLAPLFERLLARAPGER
ncbi:MAG: hypothetical protein CMH59_05325, partial [Myxococcales bacterium]|nr:hypothetical protein [Myxococcales bacterium]